MNTLISREGLLELIQHNTGAISVSFFLPTPRPATHALEGSQKLRGLVREAEEQMKRFFIPKAQMDLVLSPVLALAEDEKFWKHHADGLAVFSSTDFFRYYSIPLALREEFIVGPRFYVKPLIPLLHAPAHFYIATLAKHNPKLYRATPYHLVEVPLPELSPTFEESVASPAHRHELAIHAGRGSGGHAGSAVLAAHSSTEDDEKEGLERYMAEISTEVSRKIGTEQAPLILAGVDYLIPMYRAANRYPHLHAGHLTGSPDHIGILRLRDEALELLNGTSEHKYYQQQEAEAKARKQYQALIGTGKASDNAEEIIVASAEGRVESLFVNQDRKLWGSYNAEERRVKFYEMPEQDGDELADFASAEALRHGGEVFLASSDKMPSRGTLAAIYRF